MYLHIFLEVIYILIFFLFIIFTIAFATLVERKVMGSIQRRRGPNVVGIFGFLQPFADAIKLILKENIVPQQSDSYIFLLAPITLIRLLKVLFI